MVDLKKEEREIRQMLEIVIDAENRQDIDTLMKCVTNDAVFLKPKVPPIKGTDAWRKDYEVFFQTSSQIELVPTHIEVSATGDIAWEYGVHGSPGKELKHKHIVALRKEEGIWKSVAVCTLP
jgi:uncharacterized protein (TIGR02246 family)